MKTKLKNLLKELSERSTINNQYEVLTSSQNGVMSQTDYFNKQVASVQNIGYKIIRKGQFTYRSMSDTGLFFINRLTTTEIGIVSPAYPVFEIVSSDLLPEYLELFFRSSNFQHQISTESTGSTRLALKYNKLCDMEINVPSLCTQSEIVNDINAITNAINLEKKQLKLYDELIKSRFIEMFDGKYETKTLNEVCEELFAGGDVKKDKSSDKQSDEFPYPIYTNGEKDNGLYGYTSLVRVLKEAVTISGRGTIGFTCLRKEPFYPAVRLIVAVPDQSLVNGCYLQHFIQSKNYGGQGASIPQLTVPMIKNELIPLPPIVVQKDFQKFVEQIDKSKFVVKKKIKLLNELLNKKMDEYFN